LALKELADEKEKLASTLKGL